MIKNFHNVFRHAFTAVPDNTDSTVRTPLEFFNRFFITMGVVGYPTLR